MANEHVREFTDANFDAEVIKSPQPVLVDFWAEWCVPCRTLGPVIDAVASDLAGKAKVGKVNIDNQKGVAMKYGIQAIPTVMIFHGGQAVKKFVGYQKKDTLAAALAEVGAK